MINAVSTKNETNMFGLTIEELNREIDYFKQSPFGLKSESDYAVCVMSDAQEAISRGHLEIARLYLNKAKYALCRNN